MKKIILVCCMFVGLTIAASAQTKVSGSADPVQKAKGLQKELKLNDTQTSKIAAIYEESAEKFNKIKVEQHGDNTKMVNAIKPLRDETIKKIKAVLTPAQATKYQQLVDSKKNTGGNGWSDGWTSASTGN